jgi:hypothetical protein
VTCGNLVIIDGYKFLGTKFSFEYIAAKNNEDFLNVKMRL